VGSCFSGFGPSSEEVDSGGEGTGVDTATFSPCSGLAAGGVGSEPSGDVPSGVDAPSGGGVYSPSSSSSSSSSSG
jgi:hypothetical protein